MRLENTWHEIRDHSFIQNHSRSSDSQLLLFSSLTHLLQGSGQRTPDTRSETFLHPESLQIFRFTASPLQFTHSSSTGFRSENTWHEIRDIPSSRITPDLQIHSFSSSVHSLIFYRVQVREHLTRDQRSFLHPESLQIFRFTASSLQFTHSSSTGFRSENTWHEIRDHSFIQNHSRSSDSQLLLFSSPHSSSTGFGSENTWHEIRDHSFIQNHSRSSDSQLLLFSSPHSSSTGFRSENTWHEIRDHSFIQNHSRSSDSQLLLFSSLTHLLQGSDQRTPDTRSETIPSSRITPDLQIHSFFSSVHSSSTGFRSENTWHEIRDHSFIQNHSRSSDSQLLLFSSLTHLLQGSGQRTPDTRSETIPSSRITPDLQIHSFSSSVHSLIFYRVQIREHLTRDQRPFLHPESLQIFRFTASPLQFIHSSSTGFRSEDTWHEIRDHSFIQNHSRSSDSQLLLFSSLTHLLQGSGQRTPDTRSETIPSSRITPDLQIHSFFSSVHSSSTGFRSENTWHEIRDHSFIQNHSRSSDSQLLLFSSLTHLLQGSGQRTPDTRSETIPSSRITTDPLDSQLLLFSSPHSSSTGFRSENTWHEIRDHSFIQNHSRSFIFTASPLQFTSLIFYRVQVREHLIRDQRPFLHPESLQILYIHSFSSSVHLTHLLQGSGQRTPDTRSETIPSSRITPDLQIHSFFSSVHSLIFYRVQVREHLTRDQRPFLHPESLQILYIHSFSSSVHLTHLLQGSGQRTPDTRSETIPSSRITPDLQIHSFFSSVHSLIFYRVQVREHLTWDQRPFLHPESLQIFRFTASSLQFTHSSSTGFRSENTWHEIRDHSFIQNHSRSSDSQLLLFSSLTHLLQGSDQRTPDTRSETIPSSRITPDLQIHSFFSSVHSLIFYRVQVREHLTRDQRPFLHPESLQIFRFTASPLQFTHSSSTGFRSENTWHEIRDHSFIQNHSRSSDSQLLLFSSLTHLLQVQIREHLTRDQRPFLHPESLQIFRFTASSLQFTHLLQGSGQRTPDTRSETIPSSRITPDLQIHSFFSSVHSLIFYRVQVREHLTRDQRPFLHPESLQIFRFTASPLQFTHSSSTGFRSENTWHEIRDHSFIQNHSRSSDSQLLLFSSFTHLLQGSDQRTPDTRSETIPSSRITPDLQIHSFSSSVHSLIFYRVQVREHLTRDQRPFLHPESLQIFRFTASSLQFTHLLQGSGQRTPDTRSETIPSSRITPDLQIHSFSSSVHSLIFYRVQVREHLTRDQRPFLHPESLQILYIHSFSSSVHLTHLLQGSGQRTPDTRSETIPSSRITPDPYIHSFSSSVHLTHLLQGSGQRTPDTRSETIPSSRITPDLQIHSFFSSVHSLIFYRVQVREHLTRDQRPFLHPESLQILIFTASPLQFTSLIFYRVQVREHLTRDQRPFLHPESLQIFRFTASSLQFTHSSSTGFRSENTWHEIRDHSFIQNHSRSSDSQLLLFSSLTHLLQGSGQRTPDTRSETIPSSRITPDLQIHSFFSSVHSLIFYRVQIREHLTRDQRPFLHPESLQIFRFTASSLQFTHSSSTGFRSENTWHEIRDHSFIQNHSRSSDSQLLLFSSLTHLLQGSGQRTPDTRSETIPSSRITPDLQIHSFSSSVHSLIFYRVQVREHLTRDQRPFLHPESLQIFRFTASPLQFTHSSSTGFRSENTWHEIRDHSFIQNHSRSSDSQLLLFSSPHSSSTGFRSENTWHEIRDHSFIQNHSRSSDSQLLLFSSLTHLLQGSGQRTPDTRSETIPSSRITPDPLYSQLLLFSSPHSSSTGFRSENTWHEIRDHSFIQNHSRSSDSQLLLFSSLTHLLQGSGQRTPDTRSEIIPSSRITPDLQIHSFSSSVHLTHLLQGSGQRTPDTRSETIPSSRITPDLQIHSFFSSVHSLIFYRVQVREHLTRDQRPFLHPESLQIFRFTASSLRFTSLIFYRVLVREHLTRDQRHSFIQNHSRSSDSPHSSSTGFRSENTWHEIRDIPSSRITPDLQIHSFFSSVHSLIFYRVQIREHLTRDQRSFLHPESLQIFRFTASSLQFTHSSSTGFRSENTWHEIRDHSFIQNHSRSSDSQLLLFSSLTHLLQGSGQRTEWPAEAWFCAQWPIFVLFLGFVFGLLSGWKIQTWFIIIFLTESVTCWFFYLLVFDRIHDAMRLNKMSRTSSRNIDSQHQKYSSIFHCTHGVCLCVHQTHLECLLLKSSFVSFIWP